MTFAESRDENVSQKVRFMKKCHLKNKHCQMFIFEKIYNFYYYFINWICPFFHNVRYLTIGFRKMRPLQKLYLLWHIFGSRFHKHCHILAKTKQTNSRWKWFVPSNLLEHCFTVCNIGRLGTRRCRSDECDVSQWRED